jgi:hypothetical protein
VLSNTEIANKTEADVVKYFCNSAFPEITNPCSSMKFPGTMVGVLRRDDLHLLGGISRVHCVYNPEELVAWWHPTNRQIPPLKFPQVQKENKAATASIKSAIQIENLDFGGEDGYFYYNNHSFIAIENLDFGGDSGFFEIRV